MGRERSSASVSLDFMALYKFYSYLILSYYHNGGDYFPLEQCLPPEDILRGRHNSVTPAGIQNGALS